MINNNKVVNTVLRYFFINRQAKRYVNDLARALAIDPGNLYRQLKALEKEGLLASEAIGNQKFYFLNKKYSLLAETEKIFRQKYGLEEVLKEQLKSLSGLEKAYLFGSYGTNSFDNQSDLDLLLIGTHSSLAAQKLLASLQKEIGREINLVDYTPKEWRQKQQNQDDFVGNVLKNKPIQLI